MGQPGSVERPQRLGQGVQRGGSAAGDEVDEHGPVGRPEVAAGETTGDRRDDGVGLGGEQGHELRRDRQVPPRGRLARPVGLGASRAPRPARGDGRSATVRAGRPSGVPLPAVGRWCDAAAGAPRGGRAAAAIRAGRRWRAIRPRARARPRRRGAIGGPRRGAPPAAGRLRAGPPPPPAAAVGGRSAGRRRRRPRPPACGPTASAARCRRRGRPAVRRAVGPGRAGRCRAASR